MSSTLEDIASALRPGSLRCPYDGEICTIAYCRDDRRKRCAPGLRVLDAAEKLRLKDQQDQAAKK